MREIIKKGSKKWYLIHPIWFAIYSILSLWNANIESVLFDEILRSTSTSLLLTIFIVIILLLLIKNLEKVALIASVALILFFSYGHIRNILRSINFWETKYSTVLFLFPLWIILSFIWWRYVSKSIKSYSSWNLYFFWFGVFLCLIPLIEIGNYYIKSIEVESQEHQEILSYKDKFEWERGGELPDIYYIILDGYAREDILLDLYHLDNSDFVNFLEREGFYVAEKSLSNYNQTALSLASSLNMIYVNYLTESLGKTSDNRKPLNNMRVNNAVQRILVENDYQYVRINPGLLVANSQVPITTYGISDNQESATDTRSSNSFELLLMQSTAIQGLFDLVVLSSGIGSEQHIFNEVSYKIHRERNLRAFDELKCFDGNDGNYFVYTHFSLPHPPFTFTADGSAVPISDAHSHISGDLKPGERGAYMEKYLNQLTFVSLKMQEVITEILLNSETAPIIIIQSDHGPGAFLQWDSLEESNHRERHSILNAYYFPDGDYSGLYPNISPVNTFRVLFNTYFNGNFAILEDRSYYSSFDYPYSFHDVTHLMDP